MTEKSETPIAGKILGTEFVDNETIIVEVEKEGEFWHEIYEFIEAEKVE